ncbi:hypothetical protein VP501E541_P0272 [Vibrio phage 501E54-1]|nr:hypothetical protein VP501E541_P0272 [Vibrio phage 501E54-1]
MTSHELAKLLLENNDAPISATAEIETGVYDKYSDEVIAHLECYSVIECIALEDRPNGEVIENIIKFESSGSRVHGIDVVQVVSDAARKLQEDK